jgi:hypothetical protein
MASARPVETRNLDTSAAIERAVLDDDWSGVSQEMRGRIIARLRAFVQEGIDSGPLIEVDTHDFFEDIKRRGRVRLERDKKVA